MQSGIGVECVVNAGHDKKRLGAPRGGGKLREKFRNCSKNISLGFFYAQRTVQWTQ